MRLLTTFVAAVAMLFAAAVGAQATIVTCESVNYRNQECSVPDGPVTLTRQLSSPPGDCIEGRTWGVDRNTIWVSNGCRAEFRVGYDGRHRPRPEPQTLTCESVNYRNQECSVPDGPVSLIRQLSTPPGDCIEGRTWGVGRNTIWVSNGCRAEFRVGYDGGYRPRPEPSMQTVTCESVNYRNRECPVPDGPVSLLRQLSTTPGDCIEGRTWGVSGSVIWVSNGCRAEFHVGYGSGYAPPPEENPAVAPERNPGGGGR